MSLSDMLITILIFTIISALMIGIYFTYTGIYKTQIAYNELNSNSIIAFDNITKNIRGATNVIEQATINSTSYTTDYETLVLEIPSIDDDQLIINDTHDYLVFYRDPSDTSLIKFSLEPNASSSRDVQNRLISEYVSEIIFNFNNLDYSQVTKIETILVTTQSSGSSDQEIIMQNTTNLRNK